MTEASSIALTAAAAADAKKATDVEVLDLKGISDVTDAIMICTAANNRLADSVVDEIEERVSAEWGLDPLSIEGRDDGVWILVDYGAVVVHVFAPEARSFYRLEKLWGDAPRLDAPRLDAVAAE